MNSTARRFAQPLVWAGFLTRAQCGANALQAFIEAVLPKSGSPNNPLVCRYCGLETAVPHAGARDCIDALERERNRLREQLLQRRPGDTAVSGPTSIRDDARAPVASLAPSPVNLHLARCHTPSDWANEPFALALLIAPRECLHRGRTAPRALKGEGRDDSPPSHGLSVRASWLCEPCPMAFLTMCDRDIPALCFSGQSVQQARIPSLPSICTMSVRCVRIGTAPTRALPLI